MYNTSITDKHPSIRMAGIGALIGGLMGIVAVAVVAISMHLSGAPTPEMVDTLKVLVPGLIVGGAAMGGAASLVKYQSRLWEVAILPQNTTVPTPQNVEQVPVEVYEDEGAPVVTAPNNDLANQVAICAYEQAEWHYKYNRDPSRDAFAARGVTQPIWNSGRDILKAMGIVSEDGKGWAQVEWAAVEKAFEHVRPDVDRVWLVRVDNNRHFTHLMLGQLSNNRYTVTAPPQVSV